MLGLGLWVQFDGLSRDDRTGRERRVRRLQVMNGKSAPESYDRWRPIWRHANPYSSGVVVEGGLAVSVGGPDLADLTWRT